MKVFKLVLVTVIFIASPEANASIGASWVTGKITNITSIDSGILVRIEADEVPENCTTTTKWMEIKQEKTAMTSLTITAWTLGRKVTVYTSAGSTGYCQIGQVDPFES
ncbi:MAG: hypothetical protein OQK04_05280 [Kangiellaceae bacterium]|nr:hypothetical protein [Kangiellaceae bacterium]MCW8998107.1 hypothetical protein [Kangiellaceae bacterium]